MVAKKKKHDKALGSLQNSLDTFLELKKSYNLKATQIFKDLNTTPKTYRTTLKCFRCDNKIPAISLLLPQLVSDFYEKANHLNVPLASLCAPIKNASILSSFSYRKNINKKKFFSCWCRRTKI